MSDWTEEEIARLAAKIRERVNLRSEAATRVPDASLTADRDKWRRRALALASAMGMDDSGVALDEELAKLRTADAQPEPEHCGGCGDPSYYASRGCPGLRRESGRQTPQSFQKVTNEVKEPGPLGPIDPEAQALVDRLVEENRPKATTKRRLDLPNASPAPAFVLCSHCAATLRNGTLFHEPACPWVAKGAAPSSCPAVGELWISFDNMQIARGIFNNEEHCREDAKTYGDRDGGWRVEGPFVLAETLRRPIGLALDDIRCERWNVAEKTLREAYGETYGAGSGAHNGTVRAKRRGQ